ncbi:unnamed protein product, partial [Rotaria sordida]
DRPLKENTQQ